MVIEINKEVLKAWGYDYSTDAEVCKQIKDDMLYLLSHNRQYTKAQWECVQELSDLIHCCFDVVLEV
jgi:hypothetical protein